MRTGAAGAIASKYLVNGTPNSLGIIGCGMQATFQVLAISTIFNFNRIYIFDIKKDRALRLLKTFPKLPIVISNIEQAAGCDIVCTQTPSRGAVVHKDWIKDGAHINAIGADAPGKRELDPSILKYAKIVVDSMEQAKHGGEINLPLKEGIITEGDIYATLGEIVSGLKKGRTGNETTIFDSTGLAIQDIAVAGMLYEKAKKRKIGKPVEFIDHVLEPLDKDSLVYSRKGRKKRMKKT